MLREISQISYSSSLPLWVVGSGMVLGSFQCRGILLLWHMVGQGPAVLAAGAGLVACFFLILFSSHLSYLPFLMPVSLETAGHTEILWSCPF